MAEGGTPADFERWVEPHLTALARYAGRQVAPAERDDVVQQALIRAYQRWATYDASRCTPVAWLLRTLASGSSREHITQPTREMVELVDRAATGPQTGDVDVERAIEGLGRREQQAVDLRYFVGLDVATVAEVVRAVPGAVEARLVQARDRLCLLVGDDDDQDLMGQRLSIAARRWQDDQPPPPEVPLPRLDESPRRHLPWRRALAGAAVVLLVGGAVAVASSLSSEGDSPPASADPSPAPNVHRAVKVVPFRDLEPAHRALGQAENGVRVTPYDDIAATGHISGTVHPGDTLAFDVMLQAPGLVSLLPCPDYTITFGALAVTRRLNCAEVPYFASLVRSDDKVTSFRPVLPAGVQVVFRMRVTVPDEPGRQTVLWTLDGPQEMPGFDGIVEVTPR